MTGVRPRADAPAPARWCLAVLVALGLLVLGGTASAAQQTGPVRTASAHVHLAGRLGLPAVLPVGHSGDRLAPRPLRGPTAVALPGGSPRPGAAALVALGAAADPAAALRAAQLRPRSARGPPGSG
jgi:hypothetical protein